LLSVDSGHFRPGPFPDTVLPEYGGLGLANVVPTVEHLFGIPTDIPSLAETALPPAMLDGVRRVVTLLIDALGYAQLERAMGGGHAPYLAEILNRDFAHLGVITSTFPSTTVCALTTLGTGLPPGQHGVTNQRMYDPALGTLIDILWFGPVVAGRPLEKVGVEPAAWIGLPTVYEKLGPVGVESIVVNHAQFEGTSLSRINHRGARYRGFRTISDLCVNLRAVLEEPTGRAYVHSYWGTLDTITHEYGASSAQHDAEVRVIDHALGEILLRGLRAPGTLLLLLADHGHIDSDPNRMVWLNDHPELLALLQAPPAGLDRAVVLYVRPGLEADARRYVQAHLGNAAHVLTAEESLALGLYGPQPPSAKARERIGQLLLLPRDNWNLKYQHPGHDRKHTTVGKHGGLSPEEMIVPLIALRLD
jgi:hypothetical protein